VKLSLNSCCNVRIEFCCKYPQLYGELEFKSKSFKANIIQSRENPNIKGLYVIQNVAADILRSPN